MLFSSFHSDGLKTECSEGTLALIMFILFPPVHFLCGLRRGAVLYGSESQDQRALCQRIPVIRI